MCLVTDLKPNDIIYCVPIYTGIETPAPNSEHLSIEVYSFISYKEMEHSKQYDLNLHTIVGEGAVMYVPINWDLDDILVCYYTESCTWAITTSFELASKYYNAYLNDELLDLIHKYYRMWDDEWSIDVKFIFH